MITTGLKIIFSTLVIWYLFSQSNPEQLVANINAVNPVGLVAAALIMNIMPALQAIRWLLIIRAIGVAIRFQDAFSNVLIGICFNQILPSSIGGDAIRMWRSCRLGLGVIPAVHSVMLDRLVALLALVLIVGVSSSALFSLLGNRPERWGVPIIVVGGLSAFVALFLFDRVPSRIMVWRPFLAVARLSADARQVMLNFAHALPTMAISVFIHAGSALAVYVIAQAMTLPVTFLNCLIMVPLVTLFSVLPISIAGWGVREGVMVTAFGLVGLGYDEAFALSVLFGLVIMATGVPGGILWLLDGSKRSQDRFSAEQFDDALKQDSPTHHNGQS